MDIKGVTIEEAHEMLDFLETGSVESHGTIDEICMKFANLSAFAAKLAAAISREGGDASREAASG